MDAKRVGPKIQPGTVGRMQTMPQDKLSSAHTHRIRVGDDAALLVPGQKASLAIITAVYKDLLGHRKTKISGDVALERSGAGYQNEVRIKGSYGSRYRRGQKGVIRRLIIQGSMHFDMLEGDSGSSSHAGERSNLSQNPRFDLVGTERKRSTPESLQVGIAGMGPDSDPRPASQLYRTPHNQRVAGMGTTGDIDRRHQW
jgi:hypothetical protein